MAKPNNPMTHDDLQHLEHANKILTEHLELVQLVVNQSESMLNTYVPILHTYVDSIGRLQQEFGKSVSDVMKSSRELSIMTGGTQRVIDFISAVERLNAILTPELVDKLRGLVGGSKHGE